MIASTVLRAATEEEVAVLESLLKEDQHNQIKSVRNGSEVLAEVVYVIDHGGRYAGFCTYRFGADEIFPLVVFHEFRGQGIGAEAARQLIVLLRQEGVTEVGIEILDGAEGFWSEVFKSFKYRDHGSGKYTISI